MKIVVYLPSSISRLFFNCDTDIVCSCRVSRSVVVQIIDSPRPGPVIFVSSFCENWKGCWCAWPHGPHLISRGERVRVLPVRPSPVAGDVALSSLFICIFSNNNHSDRHDVLIWEIQRRRRETHVLISTYHFNSFKKWKYIKCAPATYYISVPITLVPFPLPSLYFISRVAFFPPLETLHAQAHTHA